MATNMSGQAEVQVDRGCPTPAPAGAANRQFIIYKVTNKINGKIYIGKTAQPLYRRKAQHIYDAKKGCPFLFYNAMRKYGADSFLFETLFYCLSEKDMNQKEIETIEMMNSTNRDIGYNRTNGGEGSLGRKLSEESIAKMRLHHTGAHVTEETREKIRIASTGRAHSAEAKAKIGASKVGKPLSLEHREKLRQAKLGTHRTEETKAKIGAASKGNKYRLGSKASSETRLKMSLAQIKRNKANGENKANS